MYRFGSFLHVDVPQGDVVQFGFRQSVSHESYAVHAVAGYIFNADVAELCRMIAAPIPVVVRAEIDNTPQADIGFDAPHIQGFRNSRLCPGWT